MIKFRPDLYRLGFPGEPPGLEAEEVPGFRLEPEQVPGFRLKADGSIRESTVPGAPPGSGLGSGPLELFARPYGPDDVAANGAEAPPYLTHRDLSGQSPGTSSSVSNLLLDSSTPRGAMPVSCTSSGGALACTTPGGTSFGPLPAPKVFPNIPSDARSRHEYQFESDPFTNPKEVMRNVVEQPTGGPADLNSPATRSGTRNEATPQPYYTLAEAIKAASGLHVPLGPVKSYVTNDQDGNQIVVNITEPGHQLFPGYVVHRIIKSDDGLYKLVTEGEGLGLLQAPDAPQALRDFLNKRTWQEYHKGIVDRSRRY